VSHLEAMGAIVDLLANSPAGSLSEAVKAYHHHAREVAVYTADGYATPDRTARPGSYVRSAESPRMSRLANIPTVERRRAALELLLERAK
jgi:hypothetical protein